MLRRVTQSSGAKKRSRRITWANLVDQLDLFAQPLPSFQIRGRSSIPSAFGVLMSVLFFATAFIYSSVKFIELSGRSNPNVSSFEEFNEVENEKFNFDQHGMRFAFGIEGHRD